MTPLEIKKSLAKQGCNLAMIASALGVSSAAVGNTINRKATSHRIASAISQMLGLDLLSVFPEYKNILPRIDTPKKTSQAHEKLREIVTQL